MQNNINNNYNFGNQFFQENYQNNQQNHLCMDKLIEKPNKYCHISIPIIAEFIAILADFISIYTFCLELKDNNLINMMMDYSILNYFLPIIVFFIIILILGKGLYMLLLKNCFFKFVRKGTIIYRYKLKKCPICGNSCNGKLIYYGNQTIKCNKIDHHSWNLELGEIIDLID